MRRLLFVFGLTVLLAAFAPAVTLAQGIIVPPPGVATDPDWLTIEEHRVDVTIEDQIATTNVSLLFVNTGEQVAEGTFLFPLPPGAAVDNLTMFVDSQAIEGRILAADEARDIYIETVRRLVDPALLEYVGSNAIQARIFPIPPGEERRIDITYGQVLEVDNGLLQYIYPLNTVGSTARFIEQMSIRVQVSGNDDIRNIYSPSHNIAINREGETGFVAGFEALDFVPDNDFSLYYGLANATISANLLSYRESASSDGFFMLLVQPPLSVDEADIAPKDVILVIDQSGSMQGIKWQQAQNAAAYVLEQLNPRDRFNVVVFSTGWRVYALDLLPADEAPAAIDWLRGLNAEGGTDINGALSTALELSDAERPTSILFLTDGLATEGITETDAILDNLNSLARNNARIFTFGVGDDVDTFLLDALVRDFRGSGAYVRPTERIDEEVASLYNKISAPVLTDVSVDFGDVLTELVYPQQMPDLFAGEQLTLVGRYRQGGETALRIAGTVNGEPQSFNYDEIAFRERAGGEAFIARLWATRRIGDLLNTIRLNGESDELVDSVVGLSIRYGIITPYTSFLIEEDDILSQTGRERAQENFREDAQELATQATGAGAVDAADTAADLSRANAPSAMPTQAAFADDAHAGGANLGATAGDAVFDEAAEAEEIAPSAPQEPRLQTVNDKTFILQEGVWTDTAYEPDAMSTEAVVFLSDDYFALLEAFPVLADYLALGERVIVVIEGIAYEVVPESSN